MIKLLSKQKEEGFTLIEVLVAILVATTFTLISMQAVVLAAYFKVKAMETAESTLLIQRDLENIRVSAATFVGSGTVCAPTNVTQGYANQLKASAVPNATTPLPGSSGRIYTLSRSSTESTTTPYNVLQVNYEVRNPNNAVVAQLYTEVIPDAAFQCP